MTFTVFKRAAGWLCAAWLGLAGVLPASAAWVQILEAQIREHGARSPDPGRWGNGLTLDISRQMSMTRRTKSRNSCCSSLSSQLSQVSSLS